MLIKASTESITYKNIFTNFNFASQIANDLMSQTVLSDLDDYMSVIENMLKYLTGIKEKGGVLEEYCTDTMERIMKDTDVLVRFINNHDDGKVFMDNYINHAMYEAFNWLESGDIVVDEDMILSETFSRSNAHDQTDISTVFYTTFFNYNKPLKSTLSIKNKKLKFKFIYDIEDNKLKKLNETVIKLGKKQKLSFSEDSDNYYIFIDLNDNYNQGIVVYKKYFKLDITTDETLMDETEILWVK